MNRAKERLRSGYVTAYQKQKLIQLMAKHPQLVAFRASQDFSHDDSQRLWQHITNECNAIPGAKKSWRQWKKSWQDIKSKIKKKHEAEGEVPTFVKRLSAAEQEALGIKNVSSTTNGQESTEFVHLDMDNTHDSFDDIGNDNDNDNGDDNDNDNASFSEPDSLPEEKVFAHSQSKDDKIGSKKSNTKHSDGCIFNCDMLQMQEQKKLQIKKDYYSFKKDYLGQKLLLLKEQTEALKTIARELGK